MQCSFYHLSWYPVVLIQSSSLFLLGIRGEKGGQRGREEEEGEGGEREEERGRATDRLKDRPIDR